MAKLYRSPAFFFRLQLLLFLITDEFNLMFCWAQFTFSIAFVQKLTPGLSDSLPCFPNPGSSLPANCSAPCLERAIVSKTNPKTRPRLSPTEKKKPHTLIVAQDSMSKARAIQDPRGLFRFTLKCSGTSSSLQSLGVLATHCAAIILASTV